VDHPAPVTSDDGRASRAVFLSYATADRKRALSACKAIERRGTKCWISTRDVAPGENYQEAIVHAVRNALAVVLIFSEPANNSDEIKKELSLASRYRVPVIALRIEDVEPSDAFAYELSTRQWIDAFDGWDPSIDLLVNRIAQISETQLVGTMTEAQATHRTRFVSRHAIRIAAAAGILLLLVIGGGWWLLRPSKAAPHSMTVRLAEGSSFCRRTCPQGCMTASTARSPRPSMPTESSAFRRHRPRLPARRRLTRWAERSTGLATPSASSPGSRMSAPA
jgi:hypothetical protein